MGMFGPSIAMMLAALTSLIGVPILLVLAYKAWMKRTRASLPQWRNSLGLTSLVLVALSWVWYAFGLAESRLAFGPRFMLLSSVAVCCALVSVLLASAWQGRSRVGAVAASILMIFGYLFFGNVSVYMRFL